jgi:hypothetical protein
MDSRFYAGIEEFNSGRYFEAHEVLEDLWHEYRETDRTFIQGLIQLSAGFYHYQCANWKGATSQLTKGLTKLEIYQPEHCGLELKDFLEAVRTCSQVTAKLLEGKQLDPESLVVPKLMFKRHPAA